MALRVQSPSGSTASAQQRGVATRIAQPRVLVGGSTQASPGSNLAHVAQVDEVDPVPRTSAVSQDAPSMRPSNESTTNPDDRLSIEDQIRGERLWWSENTSLQVRKMGFTMSQELEKSVATLREQLRQQLELERQDRQAICSEIKKELSAQRILITELEHRSEQAKSGGSVASSQQSPAIQDCMNEATRARDDAMRAAEQFRQEIEAMQAQLGALQSEVSAERERQEFKVSAVEAGVADIRRDLLMQQAVCDNLRQDLSLQADARHTVAGQQAAINDIRRELSANADVMRDERDSSSRYLEDLGCKLKELSLARVQTETTLKAEISTIRSDLLEQSQRSIPDVSRQTAPRLDEVNIKISEISSELGFLKSLREEVQRLAQELSEEKVERAQSVTAVCTHAEEVVEHGISVIRSSIESNSHSGNSKIHSLATKIAASDKDRELLAGNMATIRKELDEMIKTTTEIRGQTVSIQSEIRGQTANMQTEFHKTVADVTSIQAQVKDLGTNVTSCTGRVSALAEILENVRERHTLDMTDLRTYVTEAVSHTRSLAENGGVSVEATQELTQAMTCLRTALEEEQEKSTNIRNAFLEGRMQNTATDLRDPQSQAGQPTGVLQGASIDLVDKIRTLGTSLRTELSTRMDVVRAELEKRIEQLPSRDELEDTKGRVQDLELAAASSTGTQEQLSEVFSLTQIITAGTEKLAERIASESANWRSGKLQSDARINFLEKIVTSLGGEGSVSSDYQASEPALEMAVPEIPTLMSEDLKDTLGALVSKLNKTLNVDGNPSSIAAPREASSERRRSVSRTHNDFYRSTSPPQLRAMSTDATGGNPGLRSLMQRTDVRGGSQQPPARGAMAQGQGDLDRSNKSSTPSSTGKAPSQARMNIGPNQGTAKDGGLSRFLAAGNAQQGMQQQQQQPGKVSISPTSSLSSNTTRLGASTSLLRPGQQQQQQQQGPGLTRR